MTRAESLGGLRQMRAVVPVSVIDEELEATSLGSQIAAHLVDLPVGEPSPVVRLHQVSYSFQAHKETGRGVAANRLAGIAGFAPATFHAIGSRVAAAEMRRGFQVSITNVPGPQSPLYAAGARMVGTYPVQPLLPGHALAIGVTSYDGRVFYGIAADRDLLPDADLLGSASPRPSTSWSTPSTDGRPRAPRGRKKAPEAKAPAPAKKSHDRVYVPTTLADAGHVRRRRLHLRVRRAVRGAGRGRGVRVRRPDRRGRGRPRRCSAARPPGGGGRRGGLRGRPGGDGAGGRGPRRHRRRPDPDDDLAWFATQEIPYLDSEAS